MSLDGLGPGVVLAGARGQLFSIEQVEVIKAPAAVLGGFRPVAVGLSGGAVLKASS